MYIHNFFPDILRESHGISMRRWEDIIKMDLKDVVYEDRDCIPLTNGEVL
jgi:hypothetical protein